MNNRYQRKDASSNTQAGKDFEIAAKKFFEKKQKLLLDRSFPMHIGVGKQKKEHEFDLGCGKQKIIVECKSHRWTEGNKVPSAKMTKWNEAMYCFALAPRKYRKIMFVLRHFSEQRNETLAAYYLRTYFHLIPIDVEFWEYDETTKCAEQIREAVTRCWLRGG